jgi:hypothetical protein
VSIHYKEIYVYDGKCNLHTTVSVSGQCPYTSRNLPLDKHHCDSQCQWSVPIYYKVIYVHAVECNLYAIVSVSGQ